MFERSNALDPSYGAALNNHGQLAERRGALTIAEEKYRQAIELHPDTHFKAHNNLGQLLHRRGDIGGAETSYRAAMSIAPLYHLPMYNLATLLHTSSTRHREAEELYRTAIALFPGMPEAHSNLGALLLSTHGHTRQGLILAQECFESCLALNPAHHHAKLALRAVQDMLLRHGSQN